FFVPPAFFPP
uniref:Antamanide n=1 Tax=Amanita phalloides TaxID=67723 RepID=ANT_AMAPH|nr:RecName: Full=Antamanide; Short=ANT [Amanita phalloides]